MSLNLDIDALRQRPQVKELLDDEKFYFQQGKDVLEEFEGFKPADDSFWDEFSECCAA